MHRFTKPRFVRIIVLSIALLTLAPCPAWSATPSVIVTQIGDFVASLGPGLNEDQISCYIRTEQKKKKLKLRRYLVYHERGVNPAYEGAALLGAKNYSRIIKKTLSTVKRARKLASPEDRMTLDAEILRLRGTLSALKSYSRACKKLLPAQATPVTVVPIISPPSVEDPSDNESPIPDPNDPPSGDDDDDETPPPQPDPGGTPATGGGEEDSDGATPQNTAPTCQQFTVVETRPWYVTLAWSAVDAEASSSSLEYSLSLDGQLLGSYTGAVSYSETISSTNLADLSYRLFPGESSSFSLSVRDAAGLATTCGTKQILLPRETNVLMYINDGNETASCRDNIYTFPDGPRCHRNLFLVPDASRGGRTILESYRKAGIDSFVTVVYPGAFTVPGVPFNAQQFTTHLSRAQDYFDDLEDNLNGSAVGAGISAYQVVPGFITASVINSTFGQAYDYQCGAAPCAWGDHPYLPYGLLAGTYPDPRNSSNTITVTAEQEQAVWDNWLYWSRLAGEATAARKVFYDNEPLLWGPSADAVRSSFFSAANLSRLRARFIWLNGELLKHNIMSLYYHPRRHETHPIEGIMQALFSGFAQTPEYRLTQFYLPTPYYRVDTGQFQTKSWELIMRDHQQLGMPRRLMSQGHISSHVGENPADFYHFGWSPQAFQSWWLANKSITSAWFFYGTDSWNFQTLANQFDALNNWRNYEVTGDATLPTFNDALTTVAVVTPSGQGLRLSWPPATDSGEATAGYYQSLMTYEVFLCVADATCTLENMQSYPWILDHTGFNQQTALVKLYTYGRDISNATIESIYPFNNMHGRTIVFAVVAKDPSGNATVRATQAIFP